MMLYELDDIEKRVLLGAGGVMTHNTEQLTDTEGEWIVDPEPVHGWRVIDNTTGRKIVGNIYFEEDAQRIVADHKAAKSQALLVEALSDLGEYAAALEMMLDKQSEGEPLTRAHAALKAAGVEK